MSNKTYFFTFTKRLAVLSAVVCTLGVLAACSSTPVAAPTPYKEANAKGGYGYSSEKLADDLYRVRFKATDKTPADIVQQYALHRAAEIAQQNNYAYIAVQKTDVDKKPVLAREVTPNNDKPVILLNDRQCTMSGCEEVAQPMAGATTNDVVKKQINNIYFTITVKMSRTDDGLNKNVLDVSKVLAKPLQPKK